MGSRQSQVTVGSIDLTTAFNHPYRGARAVRHLKTSNKVEAVLRCSWRDLML